MKFKKFIGVALFTAFIGVTSARAGDVIDPSVKLFSSYDFNVNSFHVKAKGDVAQLETHTFSRNRIVYKPTTVIQSDEALTCLYNALSNTRQVISQPDYFEMLKKLHISSIVFNLHDDVALDRHADLSRPKGLLDVAEAYDDWKKDGATILENWWLPDELQHNTLQFDIVAERDRWGGDSFLCDDPTSGDGLARYLTEQSDKINEARQIKNIAHDIGVIGGSKTLPNTDNDNGTDSR